MSFTSMAMCQRLSLRSRTVLLAASLAFAAVASAGDAVRPDQVPEATHAGQPTAASRESIQDLRVVLAQAIDAPDGQAHAALVGAAAEAITAKFKATSPILVDVSTLKRYSQEGCRRLRLALSQEGVVLPGVYGGEGPHRRTVSFDLNYCRDGSPPASLQ